MPMAGDGVLVVGSDESVSLQPCPSVSQAREQSLPVTLRRLAQSHVHPSEDVVEIDLVACSLPSQ